MFLEKTVKIFSEIKQFLDYASHPLFEKKRKTMLKNPQALCMIDNESSEKYADKNRMY
jgi:hypothetical protein